MGAAELDGGRLGFRPGLDGLRGVAIILVLLGHFDVPPLASGGQAGVTLFFVLSGFLITTLLREEGKVDLVRFYRRRARRLFPALASVLIVSALWMPWSQLQPVALYYGNWTRALGEPDALGFLVHTWSLAIEEQFYLVWPLVMAFVPGRAKQVAFVGIGVAVSLRVLLWHGPENATFIYSSTLTRIDAILAGCLLALSTWRPRYLWLPIIGLAGLTTIADQEFTFEIGFTLSTALSVLAVGAATAVEGLITNPILRWFGRRSYALYLWHGVLVFGLRPQPWAHRLAVATLSLLIAEVSWWIIERPWAGARREHAEHVSYGATGHHHRLWAGRWSRSDSSRA